MIDLHCHSYFSDGLLSPAELIEKAKIAGIKMLALTDHDTTEGLKPLHHAALNSSIRIINGIEFSAKWKKYDIHILGLNIDPDNINLQNNINIHQENRETRAIEIGNKLNTCGIENAFEKAQKIAGHKSIGRPHFAHVLLQEGKIKVFQDAFKRYLGRGRIAYMPSVWLPLDEIVRTITAASGYAVIAHPFKYALTRLKLHELIKDFKLAGGVGLEVVSGMTTALQINELANLSNRYDLLASSGSDYHGDKVSLIPLGRQQQLPIDCKPIWQTW